jgi:putative transposase
MPNTYSQITIQSVFAVSGRENLILKSWRDDLHKYIAGTITGIGAKTLAVGGWLDHVHILFGLPVDKKISDLLGAVKASSSKWINEQKLTPRKFNWQSGYGAFSYSRDQRPALIDYIRKQEVHHKRITFKEEYMGLLKEFDVEYDEKYLFEFYI